MNTKLKPYNRIGLALMAGTLFLFLVAAICFWYQGQPRIIEGPISSTGRQLLVSVTDHSAFNVGSDYYADVYVSEPNGERTKVWHDDSGRGSMTEVHVFAKSLRWTSGGAIVFSVNGELKTFALSK
jgi:hypothetical protein